MVKDAVFVFGVMMVLTVVYIRFVNDSANITVLVNEISYPDYILPVVVDAQGRIFVAEDNSVCVYRKDGSVETALDVMKPRALAVKGDLLCVSSASYDSSLKVFSTSNYSLLRETYTWKVPKGVGFLSTGQIAVSFWTMQGRVCIFNPELTRADCFGATVLDHPGKLAVDTSDNIYVAQNNEVVVFSPDGLLIRRIKK
jgi:hypothetical protein